MLGDGFREAVYLFLLQYISEIIHTKSLRKDKRKRKGQPDPEISPFLISMISGAPAGNTQPTPKTKGAVSGDGKAGQLHFSLLGKACLPRQYLSAISPFLQHHHLLQVMTLNFTSTLATCSPHQTARLPQAQTWTQHLDSTPSPQNQSTSQKKECR